MCTYTIPSVSLLGFQGCIIYYFSPTFVCPNQEHISIICPCISPFLCPGASERREASASAKLRRISTSVDISLTIWCSGFNIMDDVATVKSLRLVAVSHPSWEGEVTASSSAD